MLACIASPWIVRLYGKGFENAWPTLIVVVLSAGILAIQTPVGQVLWASAKVYRLLTINIAQGLALLGLTYLWVDAGAMGLAAARLAALAVSSVLVFGNALVILRHYDTSSQPCVRFSEPIVRKAG